MNLGKQFKDGMLTQNPVLVQVLGMCSTMAITTSFFNGIGMGVAVTIILTLSNIIISAMRKIIPDKIRIAMFIVVIAGFVTCVDLSIQAFLPDLANSLGVFIPLIVVNCIILGRAEAFSYKNGMVASFFDGIFQGIGYTWVLLAMCIIREFLGGGTFGGGVLGAVNEAGQHVGIQIFPADYVHHPRAAGRRYLRRRHPWSRPEGHPDHPLPVPRRYADPACGRLPGAGCSDRCHAVGSGSSQEG